MCSASISYLLMSVIARSVFVRSFIRSFIYLFMHLFIFNESCQTDYFKINRTDLR